MTDMGEKKRIDAFDFIRVISMLGIVYYHFAVSCPNGYLPASLVNEKGELGYIFVTVFFMLSGALLYYRHQVPSDIPAFYKKRFFSIFPLYYSIYLILFIFNAVRYKKLFFRGHPWRLILTVLGMDGYVYQIQENYYLIGEWFLGALILLYILYPLLAKGFQCCPRLIEAICTALFLFFLQKDLIMPTPLTGIFSCLFSFAAGIVFIRIEINDPEKRNEGSGSRKFLLRRYPAAEITLILLACLSLLSGHSDSILYKIPHELQFLMNYNLQLHILGFAMFILLYRIGVLVMKPARIRSVFRKISRWTYTVFLVHHVILSKILHLILPHSQLQAVGLLIITLFIILTVSAFIWNIYSRITRYFLDT